MQKKEIRINIEDYPRELHYIFKDAKICDSSSNPSATVLYSDLEYYVKIAEKGSLAKEAEMAKLFELNCLGVSVVSYISEEKDYFVTKPAKGEDCTHYLDNPKRLCEILAETMKFLHSRQIENVPVSPCMDLYKDEMNEGIFKQDTFIHGDFCLPNIILDDWKFSSIIDLGLAGVGDRHIDIYWALWSLNYNLGTDKYTDYFLNLYGEENYNREALKIVAEKEAAI